MLLSCGSGSSGNLFGGGTGPGSNPTDGGLVINPGNLDASLGLAVDGQGVGTVSNTSLEDAACASQSRKADQIPLDIYLMLDSSGSMTDFIADGKTTKWQAVQKAIVSFVNDPASAGLGVGLQYFPLTQPGVPELCYANGECGQNGQFGPCDTISACSQTQVPCATRNDCLRGETCEPLGTCRSDDALCFAQGLYCDRQRTDPCKGPVGICEKRDICDVPPYATPAIEVAVLPGAAAAIAASVNAHMPTGSTPTGVAMTGALNHAQALAMANTTHKVVVVMATDGLPAECFPANIMTVDQAIASVAASASAAAKARPSVPTFVIGVFAPTDVGAQQNLDAIAAGGTTNKAFVINTSQDVTTAFLDALNSIRTTALTCEYAVPKPDAGELDYFAVNVRFTQGNGQVVTIPYAGQSDGGAVTAASCTDKGGWYYDVDPSGGTPTKIEMCPTSCNRLKGDNKGQVNILLGCKTESVDDIR
jgi:hypothetical protein